MENHSIKIKLNTWRLLISTFVTGILAAFATASPQISSISVKQKLSSLPNSVLPIVSKSLPSITIDPSLSEGRIEVAISLKPKDAAGLQAFADAVSNPKSDQYRKFITPEEVGERFGADQADVSNVIAFFQTNGLKVDHIGRTRITISAVGTVKQVEAAFGTKISTLTDPSDSYKFRANVTPLNVPANLVDKIESVDGIETYSRPKRRVVTLNASQTRTLYGLNIPYNAGFTGVGRTVGISSWDGYRLTNATLYINANSLPFPSAGKGTNIHEIHVGSGTSTGTDRGEGDLDYQMVLGAAPLADIYIYDGTGNNLTTVLSKEVSDNLCDVITESYGWSLGSITTANTAHTHHVSMTAVGITYMAASGDHGTDFGSFDYPDYDPEVLMVGGTTATTNSSGVRTTEVAWIRGFDTQSGEFWAGGGGWCTSSLANSASFNVRPSWQMGAGLPAVATVNKRLVPDISLHAAGGSGTTAGAYIVYWRGSASGFLGTSASSPLFAAALANVEQRLYSTGGRGSNVNKGRLGRVQDRIYQQAGRSDIYFDVTSGTIGTLPSSGGGSLNGTAANGVAGWDFATGWGAVNFNAFYKSFFEGR